MTLSLNMLTPKEIDHIGLESESGKIETRIGFGLSLHWTPRESRAHRLGALKIIEEYVSLFPDQITHYQYASGPRSPMTWTGRIPESFIDESNVAPTERFAALVIGKEEKPIFWNSRYFAYAMAGEAHPSINEPGSIKCHFPWGWAFTHIEEIVKLACRWAGFIHAIHGSAGLTLLSEAGGENRKTGLHDWRLLQEFPGLEYNNSGAYMANVEFSDGSAPRSSNWLTFLGDKNIDRLGGRSKIERLLPIGVEIEGYSGGLMLRAGDRPLFCGPDGRESIPPLYASIGKLIKPIRFENYTYGIFNTPEGIDDLEQTFKWLRRFD